MPRCLVSLVVAIAVGAGALATIASAAPSNPCGRSFVDVDNDGVCSPGDVSLDRAMTLQHGDLDFDTRAPIANPDGTIIYTPPADGHPVGLVLGRSVMLDPDLSFYAFATGNLVVHGRIAVSGSGEILSLKSCRSVLLQRGSHVQLTGDDQSTEIDVRASASLCNDATQPATLEIEGGANVDSAFFIFVTGDHVRLDSRASLRTRDPNDVGWLEIDSGDLTFGSNVHITGAPWGSLVVVNNCSATMSADRLTITAGVDVQWYLQSYNVCDQMLADGTVYNQSAYPQRLTLTRSKFTDMGSDSGGIVFRTNPNPDSTTYPCDALTFIKTKFVLQNGAGLSTSPAPRVDPTGPCTGTITSPD